ncbi:MAG: pteridine reductase [Xanthomonadales bacterium]|nr:pteridine reductase [Xanthomonadales bacterium]NNL94428.1 pteridine reductase [Xanthomonadales bacterium]
MKAVSVSTREKSRTPLALVTGAARRIGAVIACSLHERGCDVLLHFHTSKGEAHELAEGLNALRSGSARLVSADLVERQGVEKLARFVRESGDHLDVLVNNASRFYPTPAGEATQDQWDDLFGSNLRGPFFLTQALIPELRAAQGSVINIVDIHAEKPMRKHPVYCMSKAGLAMMTYSLARELGPDIRVNGVSPGAIMWPENEPPESVQKFILDRTVMKRLGAPEDIAGAVSYLAFDAPYVTGQIIAVDGGRSLNI